LSGVGLHHLPRNNFARKVTQMDVKKIFTTRNQEISKNRVGLRQKIWPGVKDTQLWNRKQQDGYTTMPRTMPLILSILDSLTPKGFPVAGVYLDLWCRVFDESFVVLNRPEDMAFTSGFTGQRRLQAWRKRLDLLQKLGFIKLAEGSNGKYSFALILNPHLVILSIRRKDISRIPKNLFNVLAERAREVKAKDFMDGK